MRTDLENCIDWYKSSWRNYQIRQQPNWKDFGVLQENSQTLEKLPALVFAGETRKLENLLAEASEGRAFLLQCGDCAELFSDCHGPRIHNLLRVILQMAIIISYSSGKNVVKVGRLAGQYAKPRSKDFESYDNQIFPAYRGDMVNSPELDLSVREPDPNRILEAYYKSAATLNLVRAFTKGGYASLSKTLDWQRHYFKSSPIMEKYKDMVQNISQSVRFINALGIDLNDPRFIETDFFVSHEALILEYEEALTRVDTTTGDWYDTSANMVWVGDRTRQLDSAHIEFIRGINNPIGIKVGPNHEVDEIIKIIQKVNPDNKKGRVSLITRFGAENIEKFLPTLLRKFSQEGLNTLWVCDPMHGNTYTNKNNKKYRHFKDILQELELFWGIHLDEGTVPGGVHLELTGDNVTECVGGISNINDSDLEMNYTTICDPRLNAEQSVELAFKIAELM